VTGLAGREFVPEDIAGEPAIAARCAATARSLCMRDRNHVEEDSADGSGGPPPRLTLAQKQDRATLGDGAA
jgi:hypothetical protein